MRVALQKDRKEIHYGWRYSPDPRKIDNTEKQLFLQKELCVSLHPDLANKLSRVEWFSLSLT